MSVARIGSTARSLTWEQLGERVEDLLVLTEGTPEHAGIALASDLLAQPLAWEELIERVEDLLAAYEGAAELAGIGLVAGLLAHAEPSCAHAGCCQRAELAGAPAATVLEFRAR